MQPYDLLMVLVLVGATVFGAWKGLAWQVASVGSIVLSYFVALNFSDSLAPYLSDQAPWNKFLAMAILYMGATLLVWAAFRTVKNAIERVQLKEFDRQIGGVVGAGKGVLLCVAITFFAVTLAQDTRELVLASKSGHYIAQFLQKADPIMPQEVHHVLDPYLNRLEKELNSAGKSPGGKDQKQGTVGKERSSASDAPRSKKKLPSSRSSAPKSRSAGKPSRRVPREPAAATDER